MYKSKGQQTGRSDERGIRQNDEDTRQTDNMKKIDKITDKIDETK